MTNSQETSLTKANVAGKSLRATVPSFIIKTLNLEAGDKLSWKLEFKNNEFIIIAKPVKKE